MIFILKKQRVSRLQFEKDVKVREIINYQKLLRAVLVVILLHRYSTYFLKRLPYTLIQDI